MSKNSGENFGRNYWALTLEGAAFMGGISMLTTGGVIALFIVTMTGSNTLVGLAITIQSLFLLTGQLVIAPHVGGIRNLPGFMFKFMLIRIIPLLMALPLFLGVNGSLAVGIFLVLYALLWMSDGLNTVPWGELCARAINPDLRGHMMGMQVVIGGAASLLTGLLLTWLLATPLLTDHYRFGVIFVIGGIILLSSLIFIRMVRDPSPVTVPAKPDLRSFYAKIPALIKRSKPLQHGLIARIPGYIGFSTITFVVVFGPSVLNITDAQVSWLVYSQIVGSLLGGYVLGEASRRFGNKAVIIISNAGVLITLGMALMLAFLPFLGYVWLVAICTIASICQGNWIGYFNYFLDIAPREDRPSFQVIGNCVGIPFSFIGFAIGAAIDKWGYVPAFFAGGLAACITIFASVRLLSRQGIKALNLPL